MQAIRDKQVGLFLNPEASQDALVDAHDIIRALGNIDTYFNTVLTEEAFFDTRERISTVDKTTEKVAHDGSIESAVSSLVDWDMRSDRNTQARHLNCVYSLVDWDMRSDRN